MEVLIKSKLGNYISTIVIGKKVYNDWFNYAFPTWKQYCKKHNIGLIIFKEDLIDQSNIFWKKATWQKLLIGKHIKESKITAKNICFLDSDILINYFNSPNIFNFYNKTKIGVVSLEKNLPYPDKNLVLKNISFGRHKYYSKNYPLDSAIFMKPEAIYKYHNFKKTYDDHFCAGLFIFNIKNHSNYLEKIFYKYKKEFVTLTNGDQPVLNYEFLKYGKLLWLDYKFQAIWIYEMAWKYPHLYRIKNKKSNEIVKCIESSLFSNYFLHFAGSWYESDFWKNNKILNSKSSVNHFKLLSKYLETKTFGLPIKKIKP